MADPRQPDHGPPRPDLETGAIPADDTRDQRAWPNQDLIEQIKETADRFARDEAARGDLKIVSRALLELRYAFKVFSRFRRQRKVSVFGSARTKADAPAYQQAVAFGRAMAASDWMVVTGAAYGIMEAGHVGAGREMSLGLNIMLPFEQSSNPVIADDPKLVHLKYFFTRKLMFVKESHAFVCLPGGFGTLDEGLEVLTLLQTGKRDMIPVLFLDPPGGTYWKRFDAFVREQLLGDGLISQEDLSLYRVTDSCDAAVAEVLGFFRVYHSMRYVREQLVLRLNRPLAPLLLERLGDAFGDILASGGFEQREALPAEADEPDLRDLPRLVLHFNRFNFGRLRQLIDRLNAAAPDELAGVDSA